MGFLFHHPAQQAIVMPPSPPPIPPAANQPTVADAGAGLAESQSRARMAGAFGSGFSGTISPDSLKPSKTSTALKTLLGGV